MRLVLPGARNPKEGVFGPNWEGPYVIEEDMGNGAYHLTSMSGAVVSRAWNAEHLRKYYQ